MAWCIGNGHASCVDFHRIFIDGDVWMGSEKRPHQEIQPWATSRIKVLFGSRLEENAPKRSNI